MTKRLVPLLACAMVATATAPASAATKCHMTFELSGWSAFYQTAHGHGRVSCDNGQSASVALSTKGGGATFGTSEIVNGKGEFSEVDGISEIFGDYAKAEGHAGAGESKMAEVVTKGTVSLALTGEGHGVDLGFAFGKFTIAKAPPSKTRRPH
jgi:hypothetical protein